MGSPGFNFGGTSNNNAPLPVFGGQGGGNPTGMLPGGYGSGPIGFPNYPMFGGGEPNSSGMVTPMSDLGIFGTGGSNPSNQSGVAGLSTGWNAITNSGANVNGAIGQQLGNDYGAGIGNLLNSIFTNGLFNPQVADAFLNAMQPAYNQGISSVESAFGAEGSRFGSAAALGIGNYASQFDLNEQQTMASMYMQAQQEQLSLLENILPTVNKEQDNSESSGWIDDLLGSLEIAGGSIGAAFTGGATLGLVGAGANTIAAGNSSGGGGGSPTPSGMSTGLNPLSTGGFNAGSNSSQDWWNMYPASYWQDVSAGATLGGSSGPTAGSDLGLFM